MKTPPTCWFSTRIPDQQVIRTSARISCEAVLESALRSGLHLHQFPKCEQMNAVRRQSVSLRSFREALGSQPHEPDCANYPDVKEDVGEATHRTALSQILKSFCKLIFVILLSLALPSRQRQRCGKSWKGWSTETHAQLWLKLITWHGVSFCVTTF